MTDQSKPAEPTYVTLIEEYLERTFGHQPDKNGDENLSERYRHVDEAIIALARAVLHTIPPPENGAILTRLQEVRDEIRAAIYRAHFP